MPGEDFFDPTLFKGIHHVTGGPMRIPCGPVIAPALWSIEVPEGYAFSLDTETLSKNPDDSCAVLQIQKADREDFADPLGAEVSLTVSCSAYIGTESMHWEDVQEEFPFDHVAGLMQPLTDGMLLARTPRETDEKQETESFYLTCPTIDAIFIGKIAVSMERPAKEREQIRQRFYESIRRTNLWKSEKEPKLHQPFLFGRLSFDENQWYETDGGIRLPVPDGCRGMPSRIDFSSWDLTSLGLSEEQQEEVWQVETPEAMISPTDNSMGFFGDNALYIRILRSDTIPDQTGDWPDEPKKSAVRAYLNAMNSHLPEIDPDWGGVNYLSEITPSGGYIFEADVPEDGVGFRFAVATQGGFCVGYFFLRYSEPDAVEDLVDVMYDAQRLGFWYMNRVLAGIRGETEAAPPEDEEPVAWSEEEIWTAEPEEDGEDETEPEAYWQTEEAEEEEDETELAAEAQAFEPAPERAERPGEALAWARREAARTYSAPRTETHSLYGERRQSAQPTLAEQMLSGGTQLTSGGRSERRRARAEATERRILALEAEKAGLRGIRNLFRRLKLQREIDALSEKLARYRRLEEER